MPKDLFENLPSFYNSVINSESYLRRLNTSVSMANHCSEGNSPEKQNWLLCLALRINGLYIVSSKRLVEEGFSARYPDGVALQAPDAFKVEGRTSYDWETDSLICWLPFYKPKHRIACSAVRGKDGFIISGIRHYDAVMFYNIMCQKDPDNFTQQPDEHQGFVDNYNVYWTREEAFSIAEAADQIRNTEGLFDHLVRSRRLHSELLY